MGGEHHEVVLEGRKSQALCMIFTVASAYQGSHATLVTAQGHVRGFVSHHQGMAGVESVLFVQGLPLSWGRLAAVAAVLWGVGTKGGTGKGDAMACEDIRKSGLHALEFCFREDPPTNAALVGDEEKPYPQLAQMGHEGRYSGDEAYGIRVAEVVALLDKGAVTVEKYGIDGGKWHGRLCGRGCG